MSIQILCPAASLMFVTEILCIYDPVPQIAGKGINLL